MKKTIIAFAVTVVAFYGCNNNSQTAEQAVVTETTSEETATNSAEGTHVLDTERTVLKWEGGKKIVPSSHNGTIKVSEGTLTLQDGSLTAGSFTIAMNTIENDDLKGTGKDADLVGHLKNADFFDVEKYPTATFVLTSAEAVEDNAAATHNITGTLTIKEKTNTITFPATVSVNGSEVNAKAKFSIDRSLWDVQYGSESFFKNLGDKVIKNEIDFDLDLTANAK